MTEDEAYAAMFFFLKAHYEREPSDVIGGLLGSLSLREDGTPADPAMLADWKDAIKHALGHKADSLTLEK